MRFFMVVLVSFSLSAQGPFDGKSGPLVKEAYQLLDSGQVNQALAKFQEAAKADSKSSFPISGLGKLFFEASQHTDAKHQSEYQGKAIEFSREALNLNDLDFVANEVLLNLDGTSADSLHKPTPEALQAFNQGELAFQSQKWDEAASGYQRALSIDPAYTDAALYLGDTYFSRKMYDRAEPWFRKATELEPRYGRAWRFLADCNKDLGHEDLAITCDYNAIAALPSDFTAWGRLKSELENQGNGVLIRFHWPQIQASGVSHDASGKANINVPQSLIGDSIESQAALIYSMMIAITQVADEKPENKGNKRSTLERESLAWKAAMEGYENSLKEKKLTPHDSTWAQLLTFYKSDQLKPALMILAYRESYRPDFEAWKKANPNGVRAFIEHWHLRP